MGADHFQRRYGSGNERLTRVLGAAPANPGPIHAHARHPHADCALELQPEATRLCALAEMPIAAAARLPDATDKSGFLDDWATDEEETVDATTANRS